MSRDPRSAAQRGYDAAHRKRRKELLPFALGTPCPLCGAVMLEGHDLDLDHARPLALGGDLTSARIVHSRCNRQAGQALGEALKRQRRYPTPPVTRAQSREW